MHLPSTQLFHGLVVQGWLARLPPRQLNCFGGIPCRDFHGFLRAASEGCRGVHGKMGGVI